MKKKKFFRIAAFAFIITLSGCDKEGVNDDTSFLNTSVTANPGKIFDISNDNSGNVKITPTGEGASSYIVKFGPYVNPAKRK